MLPVIADQKWFIYAGGLLLSYAAGFVLTYFFGVPKEANNPPKLWKSWKCSDSTGGALLWQHLV